MNLVPHVFLLANLQQQEVIRMNMRYLQKITDAVRMHPDFDEEEFREFTSRSIYDWETALSHYLREKYG